MHARDVAPDAGIARLGAVDDVDAAHAFALQPVRDGDAALSAADDDDVVIGAGARAYPVCGIAPGPTQRVARLRLKLRSTVRAGGGGSGFRLRAGLGEAGRGAQAANRESGS